MKTIFGDFVQFSAKNTKILIDFRHYIHK
jgi:hypothetical protein